MNKIYLSVLSLALVACVFVACKKTSTTEGTLAVTGCERNCVDGFNTCFDDCENFHGQLGTGLVPCGKECETVMNSCATGCKCEQDCVATFNPCFDGCVAKHGELGEGLLSCAQACETAAASCVEATCNT